MAATQEGYDHSYYFISTFMDEHLDFHAAALTGKGAQQ
jgi:S-formylglutathione hydrolase